MRIMVCFLLLVPAAHCFQKQEREEITRTLKFQEQKDSRCLLVDNTHGSITVTGYDGEVVQLTAIRLTRAASDEKFQESKEDVLLEMKERRDRIEVVVDAPWRSKWGGINDHGYRYYGYEVEFDFHIKVPTKTRLYLRTINKGDIIVKGVEGDFEVKNVNGDVEMNEMAGSGRVSTVNGSLFVTFRKNPTNNCSFHTVNGKVEVAFQQSLSADLVLKTFNGKAYTDFDVTPVPRTPVVAEERGGKKIYRREDRSTVRVGNGGPELAFDTLNGNIHILIHQ